MRAPPPETKKAESRANAIQPSDHETSKGNEILENVPRSVESVKRDPWLTLGLLRDDLKIIAALIAVPDEGARQLAHRRALKALHRVGTGELSAEVWR